MASLSEIENAVGAELLRARLLGRPPPMLGKRYVLEGLLGRGASGLVLAARDDRLNRAVALKVRPADGDTAMLAEARALARIDHPNVVRVHDVDVVGAELDGRSFRLWIVSMARIEGRTMRTWLGERARTPAEILGVCIDAARGLAAAHAERIVHRDVKPDNVVVRPDGVAQVLDFGFARHTASTRADAAAMTVAGTDPYMAPEARLGRATRRSDQFSLGVTIVEALTGDPVPAGSRAPRGVPAALWEVARRATSADPNERYDGMDALLEALTRAARDPTPARPRRAWLAIVLLVAAAGLAGLARSGIRSLDDVLALVAIPTAAPTDASGPDGSDGGAQLVDLAPIVEPPAADEDGGAAPVAAEPTCVIADGRYRFATQWVSGARPSATSAHYFLTIAHDDDPIASLRRTDSGARNLLVHEAVATGCTLRIVAEMVGARTYTFSLTIEGDQVSGTFSTEGGGAYTGNVLPDP